MIRAKTLAPALAVAVMGTWVPSPDAAWAQESKVRAVLFYSPTCPHCHRVVMTDLPAIFGRFGGPPRVHQGDAGHVVVNGQIEVLLVDASRPLGNMLYQATTHALEIPEDRSGVPRLVCGETVLVGSLEIPDQFPELVARGLAAGGVPWPVVPGLADVFPAGYDAGLGPGPPIVPRVADSSMAASLVADSRAAPGSTAPSTGAASSASREPHAAGPGAPDPNRATSVPNRETEAEPGPAAPAPDPLAVPAGVLERRPGIGVLKWTMATDPFGGTLALLLLAAMLVILAWILVRRPTYQSPGEGRAVPALIGLGVAIAGYLAYVEASGSLAVCGPVGDCNTVQQSPYARLFGVVPVAFLGVLGYLGILGTWILARRGRPQVRAGAAVMSFMLAFGGTVASAALTTLEPFVIGAVCAWCLASAAIMSALLWLLAGPGITGMRAIMAPP